ncbi:hypothetical protein B1023_13640 [Enterobacter hormaechei]|nr:hypothetical protein B1023_13640 [Enterobacter hormaechei]
MRTPSYSTPYNIASFAPPGVDVVSHMVIVRFHGGPSLMTYIWFYQMVRNHGPWDYKQGRAEYANFGNFHYGAVGAAAGIPEGILLRGAGTAQILAGTSDPDEFAKFQNNNNYGDDPVDQLWIRAGIDYARRSGF